MKRIAIFLSGGGSNAREIVEYFDDHAAIEVVLIVSNKASATGLQLADEYGLSKAVISPKCLNEDDHILNVLQLECVDYIVLAGFLLKIPVRMIDRFPDRIFNIHPSLLPKYGGKGMYGMNVHKAVKENQESESGMTIHLVNEEFDKGRILFQERCEVDAKDTVEMIAGKVLALEHRYYAEVIEGFVLEL